jgi:hypothetical protein
MEWTQEYWVKEPGDYEILRWIVERTEVVPQYDEYERAEERAGDHGVVTINGGRTPAVSIQVEYSGDQRFALDVGLEAEEMHSFYEALKKLFLVTNRVIAEGPGRYVKWPENVTADMLGPKRYESLLLPVYYEAVPVLAAGGKRAMVHYDGRLKSISDQVAAAPFHIIESLTEPPEGDMTLDQCRAAWPGKALWANINVGLFSLPPDELREAVMAMRERAGKQGLALEISEDVPANWRESVPVVLRALADVG